MALRRLLILLMLIGGIIPLANAQEETPEVTAVVEPTDVGTIVPQIPVISPTPTPDIAPWLTHWSEEVIFPQAILFTMIIDVVYADISTLTLNIQAEGQSLRTVEQSDFTDFLIETETNTEIQYLYNLTPRNAFPALSNVIYYWDIVLSNGEAVRAPGVTEFIPPDVTFVRTDDINGVVDLIYPLGRVEATGMQDTLKKVYDQLVNDIGGSHTFNLLLYERINPIDTCYSRGGEMVVTGTKGTTIPCNPDVLDASIAAAGFTPFNMLTASAVRQEIALHMVNTFLEPTWTGRDVPEWFKFGMTQMYLPGEKSYFLDYFRDAARMNNFYTLNRMANPSEEDKTVLWESQSYAMVLYMARTLGIPTLLETASTIGTEVPFIETYESIMGQSIDALIPSMQAGAFSDITEADFRLDIYIERTALPTQTLTPTEFPASPTYTPTNTATPTLTPTVTGFLSATPLPSLTPTEDVDFATVTRTPLPAGFQRAPTATVTPTVVSEDSSGSESDTQTIGITLVAIAALGVIFVAYLLFGQSRND